MFNWVHWLVQESTGSTGIDLFESAIISFIRTELGECSLLFLKLWLEMVDMSV